MISETQLSTLQENGLVSVVIPTLGGGALNNTIEQLNRGTVVPAEILLCIPEEESQRLPEFSFSNVEIVKTVCRGQVAQRAVGFQRAKHEFVLQLDDDVSLRATCLERLVACIKEGEDMAVGPRIYDIKSGTYHSFMAPTGGRSSWFERLLFRVINGAHGYKPGQIGRAGINMGLPEEPANWYDIGWLPGGCLLHKRKNLILSDFYPFKGKAYAEDLLHSILLKKKGVRLMRCGAAICDVDFSSSGVRNPIDVFKLYRSYSRAMRRVVHEIDGKLSRMYLYLFLSLLGHIALKLFSNKRRA